MANSAAELLPSDYEECGDCGFDHAYAPAQAYMWHKEHPCSYCKYDMENMRHELCCTSLEESIPPLPLGGVYCDSTVAPKGDT